VSVNAILRRARAAGVELWADPADAAALRYRAPAALPADLLDALRQNKPAILAALREEESVSPWFDPAGALEQDPTRAPPADADRADAIAERAAIAEHEGRLPRDWAERLAGLAHGPRPVGIAERDWSARLEALWRFADRHAAVLDAAGWDFAEVFGGGAAWSRLDQRGAAWLALSASALEITPDCLRWRSPEGSPRTLWRKGRGPHVRRWDRPKDH